VIFVTYNGRARSVSRSRAIGFFAIAAVFAFVAQASLAAPPNTLENFRDAAIKSRGDARRGATLFLDRRGSCSTCHTVDGRGGKIGPDLLGIADKMERTALVRAILEPSADILPGYETTVVGLADGSSTTGLVKYSGSRELQIVAADGRLSRVRKTDIERQRVSRTSMMPDNLCAQWAPSEFVDLLAYLETLRFPASTSAARPDNPESIARATKTVRLIPQYGPGVTLHRPVWYGPLLGSQGDFLAVEVERARVWRLTKSAQGDRQSLFVDLFNETRHGYIEGILGFTLHPQYATNRRYFVAMHSPLRDRVVVDVWERRANADGLSDSGERGRKLLSVEMPHINHNGCCLEFGRDGCLYVSFGDGGPQEDPDGHSQNLRSLLGKILRIDVDHRSGDGPYVVPSDNPFRAVPEARPEVWALGLREPWRFTFDRATDDLWVGDVGQGRFEEVAIVRRGENHGWNVIEGFTPFSDRYRRPDAVYTPPILSYSHRHGVSVTGGYVYRGRQAPKLVGTYVFGDFETRRIWGLRHRDRKLESLVELGRSPSRIAAFGEDADGELYVVGNDPHQIYKLDLSTVNPAPVSVREVAATSERSGVLWRHTTDRPPPGWEQPEFDDRAWTESPGGFGSPGTPGGVIRTEWRTSDIWIRRVFDAPKNVIQGGEPALRFHHDEDSEVYLNGIRVAQLCGWTTGYVELPLESAAALRPGKNVLAVHCHQVAGGQYIDLGVILYRPTASKSANAGR
jgi:putative heme-binding domain-containing protein